MSHLLRRTKKSCLKLLRKISTSKQLFVQRLDEDEEDEDEDVHVAEEQVQVEVEKKTEQLNDKQYSSSNNKPETSVQCLEYASEAAILEQEEQQQQQEQQEQQEMEQLQQPEESIHIQFDLMQYKENVRYLRHTPSNSSLDLQLEQQQQQQQQQQQLQLREVAAHTLPTQRATCSVSVGSQFDGHYHNVVIMEQPPNENYPIVKWDINGNSLDEEHFDLRQHWDAFDHRWRQLQSLQMSGKRLGSGHSQQSQRSSHHSSNCTLETWIDDAELGICDETQNLLQTNHNHNNNCNQCLKSF